ncbi:MAG: DUF481 domain-containing protein [Erythrobacter sp.]
MPAAEELRVTYRSTAALALVVYALPVPAAAQLPEPVRAMIDAAIEAGDEDTARAVIDLARTTNPEDGQEIDAILAAYEIELAAAAKVAAREEEAAIRRAGLFENWSGSGELGAFNSTGNAENTGLTAALALVREGIDWRHELRGRADYQEANGVTTREQFLAAYEPHYTISESLFAFALAQYERDRFQGFSARYAISGGLGYEVIDNESLSLALQAGPAFRRTEFVDNGSSGRIAGQASLDLDWTIADDITFTQDAGAFLQSDNSTFTAETGLQAAIADDLSVRLSFAVEHDTDPPTSAVKTDTLSRITILYDF